MYSQDTNDVLYVPEFQGDTAHEFVNRCCYVS